MSIRIMSLVWDSTVPAPERFTLLALADNANEDGVCWPSIPTLARKCATGERTVQRHLAALKKAGLVTAEQRWNSSCLYRIDLDRLRSLDNSTPRQSGTPRQSDTPPRQIGTPSPVNLAPQGCQSGLLTVIEPSVEPSKNRQAARDALATPSVAALPDPDFTDFYAAYPRRVERRKAEQAWKAALKRKADPQQMIVAAKAYADRTRGTEPRFIKHPASWLNAGAYEDEQPRASVQAALSFEDLRARGAAKDAARLIRAPWSDPNQPMSDDTPYPQWLHARAVEWIDRHEAELRAALTERKTG